MRPFFLVLAVFLSVLQCSPAMAANASESASMKPIPVGQAFPDIPLKGPLTPAESAALGLSPAAGQFRFADIKARAVILVVFSMYCPYCQREAPQLAKMHELIAARGLADSLKLVGLGAGNSAYEVNVYREKFGLTFPLLQDPDFVAHKALGQVGTPYYYVLKREGAGFVVADGSLGCLASLEEFLKSATEKTGLAGQ